MLDLPLKDSEIRYRRLFETAQDGILILDAKTGMIEDVNPYLITMLGYSRQQFVKKKLWEVGAFKDINASKDAFEALQKNEYIRYDDLPLKAKDGRLIPVEFVSNVYLVGGEKVIQCNIRNITARKHSEAVLRLVDLLNHQSRDIILFLRQDDGRILDANEAALKAYGYTRDELLALTILKLRSVSTSRLVLDQMAQADNKGILFESVHQRKDGSRFPVEISSRGVTVEGTRMLVCIIRDITERQQAQATLRESEERYRRLVEALPDGVIVHSQGQVVFANPASAAIIGAASPAELTGKPVIEFIHPDYREGALHRIQQTQNDCISASNMEEKFVRLDGTPIDVEVSGIPFSYAGTPAMLTVFTDITDRKRAETAHIQSEALFRALFEASPDAVMLIDPYASNDSGPIIDCNVAACVMNGYSHEELIGQSVDILNKTPVLPAASSDYLKKIRVSGNLKYECFHRHKNGSIFPIEVSTTLIKIGERELLMGIDRDITERKRMEEEIRNLSLTDELTGLNNRRGFNLLAEQEVKLAHRSKRPMLLFFGDVDNLKAINDNQGHACGDLALKEVSAVLKENYREADILARLGGDEFVVLALDASKESADTMTNRIQTDLEARNQKGSRSYQLSLSLGFAYYDPEAPCTLSELLTQADRLMYQQKQARKAKIERV